MQRLSNDYTQITQIFYAKHSKITSYKYVTQGLALRNFLCLRNDIMQILRRHHDFANKLHNHYANYAIIIQISCADIAQINHANRLIITSIQIIFQITQSFNYAITITQFPNFSLRR